MLVSEEVRHSNKAWRAKHYEQRKAKEKSLDYYQAKVDQVNEKRLLEKNSTTILIWWDKRFDSETHPFMEKSVLGSKWSNFLMCKMVKYCQPGLALNRANGSRSSL